MAEHFTNLATPTRLSALAEHHDANKTPTADAGVELFPYNNGTMLELHGDAHDHDFLSSARTIFGCALPILPGTTSVATHCLALWLAPDTWLIVSTNGKLKEPPDVPHGYVTDVSHARTLIRMSGRHTRDMLAKGCALDLHPRAFKPGTVARTLLAHTTVILHLRDHEGGFDLYVPRSYAVHVWQWLTHAAAEFGIYIAPLS